MNFDDTPEEAAFRAEARAWLAANAPTAQEAELAPVARAKTWQARKFDAGYAAITWPVEFGGRDGRAIDAIIFRQEETGFEPPGDIFNIGLGMCLPIVRAFGGEAQKARYLRPGLRGEEVWCQLFSEPSAGSDVAAVRTRAVRDGNGWRINGQKTWNTGAHFCDFGILLARTDASAPKHKGLTMFVVDMRAQGVTVRPVRQMNGRSDFNEVFFDDVWIPDDERLGDAGQGWQVAISTLMRERQAASGGLGLIDHDFILRLAQTLHVGGRPAIRDQRVRDRIAELYLNARALKLLGLRAQTALSKGQAPGPEQSISKAVTAAEGQQASYLAMDLMGAEGALTAEDLGEAWEPVEQSWTWGAAMRIAGGTDEILRNVIAERVLGLPADPRIDKDTPFDQLPT